MSALGEILIINAIRRRKRRRRKGISHGFYPDIELGVTPRHGGTRELLLLVGKRARRRDLDSDLVAAVPKFQIGLRVESDGGRMLNKARL